jgi:hypothetical protein
MFHDVAFQLIAVAIGAASAVLIASSIGLLGRIDAVPD